ncbi:triphosphoribosyl-dephospho-CoA synthase CitG [Companilactobacillus paralimentarius]|uniref:triphosphoribosyl-dephospho-CoA synthase CitG n=1 Tax=Companilactobacillus paralimentarius TaxID=83526 RepID=UPI00384AC4DF
MKSSKYLADAAMKALLYEVNVHPKPGLVDPTDNSTHLDMDVFTFIDSAVSLHSYFEEFAQAGIDFRGNDLRDLFKSIRPIGVRAEKAMFKATDNINTHKGAIFSLGIMLAACGYDYDNIQLTIKKMLQGLVENDFKALDSKKNLSNGEKMFLKYGVTGIRGEAENGYPTVFNNSLPYLKSQADRDLNSMLLNTLMVIVSKSYDSNVVKRGDLNSLKEIQKYAQNILNVDGCSNSEGTKILDEMNKYCNKYNLSLGGSADLLIVTIFLFLI